MKLITYAYLRQETRLSQNVPDSELDEPIDFAQEVLKGVLCTGFYDELVSQLNCNTIDGDTLTPQNAAFMPYVKKFIAWQAREEYLKTANYKITKSGVRVHSEENSVAATDIQMSQLLKTAKERSQFFKEAMIGFLKTNKDNYSFFCQCGCNVGSNLGNSFGITAVGTKRNHCGHKGIYRN